MPAPAFRPRPAALLCLAFAVLLLTVPPARAVILKLTPLKEVLEGEQLIFAANVESVAPDKPGAVFKFEEKLKGDVPFARLPVNLTGDAEAKKSDHTKILLDRLEPGRKLIVFASKKGKRYNAMAFVEGTWFSLQGSIDDDGKTVRWAFLHCEPYLRRTFVGTTAELKKVVADGLVKKAEPPPANEKEKPGFGPPVEKKSDARPVGPSLALFGVIPSLALVAPMALIGALFPGVAVRMAVAMKRWRAFLVIASTNSTLAIVHFFLLQYQVLPDWWVFSPQAFTAFLLILTVIGLFWSGRRYRRLAGEEPAVTGLPGRSEFFALGGLTLLIGVILLVSRLFANSWRELLDPPMREFTAIGAGLLVATLYAGYRVLTRTSDRLPNGTDPAVRLSLSGESVGLATVFLGTLLLVLTSGPVSPATASIGTQAGDTDEVIGPKLAEVVQVFELPDAHQVMSGVAVDGDRLYLGASKSSGFGSDGFVFCLDRHTGKQLWKFTNDDDLKPVFCTPTPAGGTVYFGEGLHTDSGCRLFAVDATTGKPTWAKPFETASHTEGTPKVRDGKVYFSAGDDGLFCANTATGERVWQLAGTPNKLHIDTPPIVAGNRLFAGSGYGTYALLCADAATGKELWRTPVNLRSFGPPLILGNRVVYGLGTGNLSLDVEGDEKTPAGAVVCVDAETGQAVWKHELTRSVHASLAADAFSVYAPCRDGAIHCLDRKTGQLRWKTGIGGAVVAGTVVATAGGMPVAVYAVSREGVVVCLNPQNGKVIWERPLPGFTWDGQEANGVFSTPAVVTTATPTGSKRTVYVGAMLLSRNTQKKMCAVFRFEDELGE